MAADVVETVWYSEDSASPLTVAKPASFASGQILVAVIVQHNNPSSQSDLGTPSGWTLQGALDGTTSDGKVFSYVFTGSDPATWDFPYRATADTCLGLFRITGADTTPTIVVTSTATETVATPMDSPSVNPTGTNDLLICLLANNGNGTIFTETDPSGMTDLGQVGVAGNFMALAAAKEQLSSGSATGVRTWTSIGPTGQTGGTLSIAVKSSSGAAASQSYIAPRHRTLSPPRSLFRRRATAPAPVQLAPLQQGKQPRRLRGLPFRRGHAFVPVPAQVVVPAPPLVQPVPHDRLRFGKTWRPRVVTPVPAQQVVPAVFVPQAVRTRVKVVSFRRHDVGSPPAELPAVVQQARPRLRLPRFSRDHIAAPVPPQAAPAAPAYPLQSRRARLKAIRPARGHIAAPAIPPAPAPLFERIRVRLVRALRRRTTAVVPAQVVVANPAYPRQATHARRVLFAGRRDRAGVTGWMTADVHICIVPRPFTGASVRPSSGVASRPDTGIVVNEC